MDIPDIPNSEQYTAAPAQTAFAFDFLIFAAADLDVYKNGVLMTLASPAVGVTQYAITFTPGVLGGTVTFGAGLAGGEEIIIQRAVPMSREGQFQNTGPLNIAALNALFDRLTVYAQDLKQGIKQSVQFAYGELGFTLPNAMARRGKVLVFDEVTGDPELADSIIAGAFTTDTLPEGIVNLFYTEARVLALTAGLYAGAGHGHAIGDITGLVAALDAKMETAGGTFVGPITVPADVYGAGWAASNEVPTKADVYAKIEAITIGGGGVATFNGRSGAVSLTAADVTAALPAFTGDVTSTAGTVGLTIAAGAVSLPKMANLAANSFIGNNTGGAATPIALTVAQAKALLALAKADVGLGNVDNTADTAKPVSTATTNALNLKSNLVPNIQAVTSSATVTPTFLNDKVNITAQAVGLTLANPTGTAQDSWGIVIRIKDNGTARAISYGTQYRAIGVTLPTTTVLSKTLYLAMMFNSADTKWDVVAVRQEA